MHPKARRFAEAAGERPEPVAARRLRTVATAVVVVALVAALATLSPSALAIVAAGAAATWLACALVSLAFGGWISHAVIVDAPVQAVWDYGSDSTRAAEWSVYFDHIVPIEGDGLAPDGTVGAYRVCYRDADRTGPRWGETTEAATPLEHREIHTFDLRGFQFGVLAQLTEYEVHQDYEAIDADTTRLTFRSRLRRPVGVAGFLVLPVLKAAYLLLGAREAGQQVFVWNLENIAAAVAARHAGVPYERPHPWAPSLGWEDEPLRWWIVSVLLRRRPRTPQATLRPQRA